MGGMDRSGVIATVHDWDIKNKGDVIDIILDRLKNEAYLRQLWIQILGMKRKARSCSLGNPVNEARMATGLAVIDYLNEIFPRQTFRELTQDGTSE